MRVVYTIIFGRYIFLRMTCGLAHGPAYFTALMQKVLGAFNDICFFNIGDVLVHDSNEEDYLKYLKMIFKKNERGRIKTETI